jgi:hypothetical protein
MIRNLIVAAAALLLTGCEYFSGADIPAGGSFYATDVLYDGFYGPFHGGYWGADGHYWYLDSANAWQRDDDGHFRHNSSLSDGLHMPGPGLPEL